MKKQLSFQNKMECYTLMFCKKRVQDHFYNKSTSDLTLLVDFYGCCMWHGLKMKFEYKIIYFTIGAILTSSRGHMLMSSILCKNRILMAHQLRSLGHMLMPLFKSTMMSLEEKKSCP